MPGSTPNKAVTCPKCGRGPLTRVYKAGDWWIWCDMCGPSRSPPGICPNCGQKIDHLILYSDAWARYYFTPDNHFELDEWEAFDGNDEYCCPECREPLISEKTAPASEDGDDCEEMAEKLLRGGE